MLIDKFNDDSIMSFQADTPGKLATIDDDDLMVLVFTSRALAWTDLAQTQALTPKPLITVNSKPGTEWSVP